MTWIMFAYSLPKNQSSDRVTLWRRLQRLGAVAPAGNLYVLPATDECVESFQWLTQEIQQKGGQAIMSRCDGFEGMSDVEIEELFCEARTKEYAPMLEEIESIGEIIANADDATLAKIPTQIAKLRRQQADVARIDYFNCPDGVLVAERLASVEKRMIATDNTVEIEVRESADYQQKIWVTRPQPHVDRLASIWLIRRFIDARAEIIYRQKLADGEITFDMPDADFGHTGNLCTLETLIATFQIEADGLLKLAEIVHEIDLHDGHYSHPEVVGIEAVLAGWRTEGLTDAELETRGLALFDGLLASMKKG